MKNRRKEKELKDQIVKLRIQEREIQAQLKQKFFDLYVSMGISHDQSVKMV